MIVADFAALIGVAFHLLSCVPAQQLPCRGQGLVEITRAGVDEIVSCMSSRANGAAPSRDGALFVLVHRIKSTSKAGHTIHDNGLELWRSNGDGSAWRRAAVAPVDQSRSGVLAPDGDLLSCLWSASEGRPFGNVYWQRFEPRTEQWIGSPMLLAEGRHTSDQFGVSDLVRTEGGALVAVFGNNADVRAPVWNCPWSTGMRWLGSGCGDQEWSPMVQVNVIPYGLCATAAARGHLVDIVYRTNPGDAIHGLRTVDGRDGEFVQESEENAGQEPAIGSWIQNQGVLCIDGTGGRTLLHVLADYQSGAGRLVVSWSRPGQPVRTATIAEDPPLEAGNNTSFHFTLARGPGNQVFAYFAKVSEHFANLWQCLVEDGLPVGAGKCVAHGKPNDFFMQTGMHHGDALTGMHVVTLGRPAAAPGGVVSAFGSWPARTIWSAPSGR